jgi:hypothetical protein
MDINSTLVPDEQKYSGRRTPGDFRVVGGFLPPEEKPAFIKRVVRTGARLEI